MKYYENKRKEDQRSGIACGYKMKEAQLIKADRK